MAFDIKANHLNLSYKKFKVLDDVSFQMESGKIYGLLGRNGAGKTSLMSILASFRQQTSGEIQIGGEAPFENTNIMQHVAFLYSADLSEETTKVKEMLQAVERYRPYYDPEYAQYLINQFNLPINKPVNKLSKGMQAALTVTLGLASRAPITIFDESYQGMDAPTREIFYKELLEDQAAHPRTIILSTHLVSEMDHLFDEVLIIDRGKLILQEDYETLVSQGASITGEAQAVDAFVSGMEQLTEQRLGGTKSVMIYGGLSDKQKREAKEKGLEIGPVSLQDLFIHLTEGED